MKAEDLRRIVGAMTERPWRVDHVAHMQHDIVDGEGEAVGTFDYSATADGTAALANHADALVALVEACEEIRPRLDHELHGAISGRHAEQIGRLLLALAAVHAVPK